MLWLFTFHKNMSNWYGKKIMEISKEQKNKSGPKLIAQAQPTATKKSKILIVLSVILIHLLQSNKWWLCLVTTWSYRPLTASHCSATQLSGWSECTVSTRFTGSNPTWANLLYGIKIPQLKIGIIYISIFHNTFMINFVKHWWKQ